MTTLPLDLTGAGVLTSAPAGAPALVFTVLGKPVPQGSFIARVMGKRAFAAPSNDNELQKWRKQVAGCAYAAVGASQWTPACDREPIRVDARFYVTPSAAALKAGHPYPSFRAGGDIDKLCRALLDGIGQAGPVWADDSQVVDLRARKVWTSLTRHDGDLDVPGVRVRVAVIS